MPLPVRDPETVKWFTETVLEDEKPPKSVPSIMVELPRKLSGEGLALPLMLVEIPPFNRTLPKKEVQPLRNIAPVTLAEVKFTNSLLFETFTMTRPV